MQWTLFFTCLTGTTLLVSCENKPAPPTENVAQRGKTSQSSDYKANRLRYEASRAIDGNETQCAHTNQEMNPWWMIDLLGIYNITFITIFNIRNAVKDVVLNGAEIYIGNSREKNGTTNQKCVTIKNFTKGQNETFQCDDGSVEGRYVTVVYPGKHYLILCEVQIYGNKTESPLKLINMTKNWEDAVDYCREMGVDLASIPDMKTQAWAELEAMQADTPFVWLGLRYTCVLEFWFWISDEYFGLWHWAPGNGTTTQCDMSGAMEKTKDHLWVAWPDTEKFNFICDMSRRVPYL